MKYTLQLTIAVFCLLLLYRCDEEGSTKVMTQLSSDVTHVDFINKVVNSDKFNIFSYRNFYNGGGVGIGDINNDGLPDIYFTANMGSNKLYLNKGNFEFEDITASAEVGLAKTWSTGVSMVDINNDGLLDIYVSNAGCIKGQSQRNTLFINEGGLSFVDRAEEYGLDDPSYTTHAAFFDYDKDGDLDVYILNNSFIPVSTLNYSNLRALSAQEWNVKDFLKGGGDKLMRNEGGKFSDVTEEAGIYNSLIGFGLGISLGDVDRDGLVDMYVSNDFFERDYLYMNQGDGTFSEELEDRIDHVSHSSMGADIADINNDAYGDIFVTDMLPDDEYRLKTTAAFDDIDLHQLKKSRGFYNQYMQNTLQLNGPSGHFKEIAYYADVAASDWSWGALIFDIDNDSWQDIMVCNGIYHDVIDRDFIEFFSNEVIQKMVLTGKKEEVNSILDSMPVNPIANKIFKNLGNSKFEDYSEAWGFDMPTFSNGAAYGDLDNDGDLDIVINNVNQPAGIFKNQSVNNYIALSLKGSQGNRDAIGAKIYIYADSVTLYRENFPHRGFQSSMDKELIIGLGKMDKIDSVVVVWPLGKRTINKNIQINEKIIIAEEVGEERLLVATIDENIKPLLSQLESSLPDHQEDAFIDFYYDRGLIQMLSQEGPLADMADINQDGYEDIFIGGPSGKLGELHYGSKSGFVSSGIIVGDNPKLEDVVVHFFDSDGDGDQDLFIGSGGNIALPNSRAMQDRLYINQGGRVFEQVIGALPRNGVNTSVVISHDYDGDGDIDLFVGSRSVPGQYGIPPKSYLLSNNGQGKFREEMIGQDETPANFGMVTDAIWVDVMGDSVKELVVVSEWLAPQIYQYIDSKLEPVSDHTNLSSYNGLWRSIDHGDLDGDGDEDLILGNVGENFYLKASVTEPLKLWIADFDQNGMHERILSRTIDSKDMPVSLKNQLADQIISFKKDNVYHRDYARKSIQDLFDPAILNNALVYGVNYLQSFIAFNQGNGQFELRPLPMEAQLSCINDALVIDLDNDDDLDIALGGNHYEWLPQFSRLDASFGLILQNDGGEFTPLKVSQSGMFVKGEIQQFIPYTDNKKKTNYLLTLINSEQPILFEY